MTVRGVPDMPSRNDAGRTQECQRPSSADPAALGLSLVETLIVLAILALSASLVILTLPDMQGRKDPVRELETFLETAEQRALVTGRPVALIRGQKGTGLAILNHGSWQTIPNANLPRGLSVEPAYPGEEQDKEAPSPLIIFDPLGHTAPVSLILISETQRRSVTFGADGEVREGKDNDF